MAMPPATTETVVPFDTSVRCDRCGSQGLVVVEFATGTLAFCGHHWRKAEQAVIRKALAVDDRRGPDAF